MPSLSKVAVAIERVVADTVVKAVDQPAVADAIFDLGRLGVMGLGKLDDLRGAVVHGFALPSHGDVRQLHAHLARLGVVLAELEARVDELRTAQDRPDG